jgi:hypothetical protein
MIRKEIKGESIQIEPVQKIEFSWVEKDEPALTSIVVKSSSDNGTSKVTPIHKDIGQGETRDPFWENCWEDRKNSLEKLASVPEAGQDLRFTTRPMLGIVLNDSNKKNTDRLGVLSSEVVRISS